MFIIKVVISGGVELYCAVTTSVFPGPFVGVYKTKNSDS